MSYDTGIVRYVCRVIRVLCGMCVVDNAIRVSCDACAMRYVPRVICDMCVLASTGAASLRAGHNQVGRPYLFPVICTTNQGAVSLMLTNERRAAPEVSGQC